MPSPLVTRQDLYDFARREGFTTHVAGTLWNMVLREMLPPGVIASGDQIEIQKAIDFWELVRDGDNWPHGYGSEFHRLTRLWVKHLMGQ